MARAIPGAEVIAAATGRQKRRVDPLDVDASVLRSLNIVRDLDQLARGNIGVGEGAASGLDSLR